MLSAILDNSVFVLATAFIIALIVAVVWFLHSRFGQSVELDYGNRKFKIKYKRGEPAAIPTPACPEPELEEEIELEFRE